MIRMLAPVKDSIFICFLKCVDFFSLCSSTEFITRYRTASQNVMVTRKMIDSRISQGISTKMSDRVIISETRRRFDMLRHNSSGKTISKSIARNPIQVAALHMTENVVFCGLSS